MSRLLARMQRGALEAEHARLIANALREAPPGTPMRDQRASAPGDPLGLRGTPIQMRGVGGTMPHTQPEAETMRRLGEWSGRGAVG